MHASRSTLRAGAVTLGLILAAAALLANESGAPRPPVAEAAIKQTTSYRAVSVRRGVASFRLRGLADFTIRHGDLRVGRVRQGVRRGVLRAGARRHRLRVPLSIRLLEARRHAEGPRRRPTLVVSIAGPLVPARGALLGAWHRVGYERWTARRVASFERAIGRRLGVDHHYHAWGTDYWPSKHIKATTSRSTASR